MTRTDVLIAGAGPTGLVLALWLTKMGIKVRIVDKTAEPGTTSRALAVQARTLELYRQLDLADAVEADGHRTRAVNLWARGKKAAHVELGAIGEGLTPYPYLQMYPQDKHEKLLIARLADLGVSVERRTELLNFNEEADHIFARIKLPGGQEETCEAAYIAGCDGAHSVVRHVIGATFEGGTYPKIFYVADVQGSGATFNGELHIDFDQSDFVIVFPMDANGRARLIGTVREEHAEHPDTLKFEDVSDKAIRNLALKINKVNWFSAYRVHHRVTDRFRKGRAFLAGDAAHVHSPVGGQGMNTGIGDAINLAWKLAWVLRGLAPDSLLDSYEPERHSFAKKLVATTDSAFNMVTADGHIADIVRTRIVPMVFPAALKLDAVRKFMFRTVSQITLNYRGDPLSVGTAGHVQGGDRLPWVAANGGENFEPLRTIGWQVHVYGEASPALTDWCAKHALPLHVFAWDAAHEKAGLARNAAYLIRPDTYVALADPSADPRVLERYFAARGIQPA
jgi:2-polyprenyl-6-methoxyphenol hydroxylase-like FAD-dependent oxidoreductase